VVAGLIVVIISTSMVGFGTLASIRGYDPYQSLPLSWLLTGAKGGGGNMRELVRRAKQRELTAEEVARVIPVALAEYETGPDKSGSKGWADLLALFDGDGDLSASQRQPFFDSIAPVSLRVRSQVLRHEPIMLELSYRDRGAPSLLYLMRLMIEEIRIGEQVVLANYAWDEFGLDGQESAWPLLLPVPAFAEGEFDVTVTVKQSLYAPNALPGITAPRWSRGVTLQDTVKVLPSDGPDPIQMVPDANRRASLLRTISVGDIEVSRVKFLFWSRSVVTAWFYLDEPARMDLAFEVVLLDGDREIPAGYIAWSKGETGWDYAMSDQVEPLTAARVTPVLRSSRQAAVWTPACFDVWEGELRFAPERLKSTD
jgi:hypothetical protein